MNSILDLDKMIFHAINTSFTSSFLDTVMIFLSGVYPWILFFSLLLIWGGMRYKKSFLKIALSLAVLVSLTDLMAFRVLKQNIARKRPCIEMTDVRLVTSCGGEFGFPSNHSANAAALALFLHLTLRRRSLTSLLVLFVFLIGYSRVYLAAHYPTDVLAGYLLGVVMAYGLYFLTRRFLHLKESF